MPYTLEALVGRKETNQGIVSRFSNANLISLKQDVWLIPLTGLLQNELSRVNEIEKIERLTELQSASSGVIWLAQQLSKNDRVAYVEAEFFGGAGGQTSAGWYGQELLFRPRQAIDAINQALHWLGVVRDNEHDEFDMIGLGQHRKTEDWAQQ
jgi:hypothetical protein